MNPKPALKFLMVFSKFIRYLQSIMSKETIWSSLITGLVASVVLISMHIFFSSKAEAHLSSKKVKIEAHDQGPTNAPKEETKLSSQALSSRSVDNIAINRETLCLFAIVFSSETPAVQIEYDIPSPLLGYLRTILTYPISVNAP